MRYKPGLHQEGRARPSHGWSLAAVVTMYILMTLVMTYPLVLHLGDHVPSDRGDPLYNVWAMAWTHHQAAAGFPDFWDANIFWPHDRALLYADHIVALSAFAAPLVLLTGNIIAAYNLLFLGSFVLCGVGMYLLVRALTASPAAAFAAGLVYAFFPYRFAHISHLELLAFGWIPLFLLAAHRIVERPRSWKPYAAAGLLFVLQALSCAYYGVFLAFFAVLFFLYFGLSRGLLRIPAFWLRSAVAAGVCALALGPLFLPYVGAHGEMRFGRGVEEVAAHSARPGHFISVPPWSFLWGRLFGTPGQQEAQLYPGLVLALLLVLGTAMAAWEIRHGYGDLRRRTGDPGASREIVGFHVMAAALAAILALGPTLTIAGRVLPGPYRLLYRWFPGFSGLRAPNRLIVLTMTSLCVLAGFAMASQLGRLRGPGTARGLTALVAVLILTDYAAFPIPLAGVAPPSEFPPVYSVLRELPGRVVLEFPMPKLGLGRSQDAMYMYYSTAHWKRLVNGYSGYTPPDYYAVREAMDDFPSPEGFKILRGLEVDYLIIHTGGFRADYGRMADEAMAGFERDARLIGRYGGECLYEIRPDRPGAPSGRD